jgi:hypothetical protein
MNRFFLSLRYITKPCASKRFRIDRKGIFNKPIKVLYDNKYWQHKADILHKRFQRTL